MWNTMKIIAVVSLFVGGYIAGNVTASHIAKSLHRKPRLSDEDAIEDAIDRGAQRAK